MKKATQMARRLSMPPPRVKEVINITIIIITLHHRDGTLEKNMERGMLMHITVTITASTVLVQALHSPVITDVITRIIITSMKLHITHTTSTVV